MAYVPGIGYIPDPTPPKTINIGGQERVIDPATGKISGYIGIPGAETYVPLGSTNPNLVHGGGSTPEEEIESTPALGSEGGGGGYTYQTISAPSIPVPDLNIELSAEQLAKILAEAEMYGALGFDTALEEIPRNIQRGEEVLERTISKMEPMYWERQRDVTAIAAQALGRWMASTNVSGRYLGGESGKVGKEITREGVEGVSRLETELANKIADARITHQDYVNDQNALRTGLQKEKGLTIAIKNLELQRQAIQEEREVRQTTFQNLLASAANDQQWKALEVQYNTFLRDTEVMLEELAMKREVHDLDLQSTRLSNEVLKRSLAGGSGVAVDENAGKIPVPIEGNIYHLTPAQYETWFMNRKSIEAAEREASKVDTFEYTTLNVMAGVAGLPKNQENAAILANWLEENKDLWIE